MDEKRRAAWIQEQLDRRIVKDERWYKARLGSMVDRLVRVFGSDAAAKWVGENITGEMSARDKFLAIVSKIESARKEK